MKRYSVLIALWLATHSASAQQITLQHKNLQLQWAQNSNGWYLRQIVTNGIRLAHPSGEYTLLYSKEKPDSTPVKIKENFPDAQYKYIIPLWKEITSPVQMNIAGEAQYFYPATATSQQNAVMFTKDLPNATVTTVWKLDPAYTSDVHVSFVLKAKQSGYFSIATPTLATALPAEMKWAGIPGHYQSNVIEKDLIKSFAYVQGIPDKPILARERTATTLSPYLEMKNNVTLAVIPDPGTGRDPWENNAKTHATWQLGLSVMNRKAMLTPTAYHPVLGQKDSWLNAGESITFSFRYTIQQADWFTVYKHAVNDIYRFRDFLHLKKTQQSLTDRILSMHKYLIDDKTSLWQVQDFKGTQIGAQQYLGGVYGSDKDAMKNSDYGAMWMLANIMQDPVLKETRLPYARNFKLSQQDKEAGFFYGTTAGQYYLWKSQRWAEEWGQYVEPIAVTYYMMMDAGNILLFQPKDTALQNTLKRAADKLLSWMDKNGRWQIAYDHTSQQPLFTEVEDLRPTFYGLVIAYKILHDKKYLDAARKGADWFIRNAVEKGCYLGVCGDTRFVSDFATGQSAQALLELYDITKDKKYRDAAITAAKFYTTSVYTHPIPTTQVKTVNGVERQDWEISQVGLSFEHGGSLGSANPHGPIVLASHAGMFVRMFSITRDSLFLNMARAAAFGRDAFVDRQTSVASYYWAAMNKGAGPYPHHAWWQVGWITDYLLAEAEMRSGGQVTFPRGFITPKVGPHQTYGFAPGKVYGTTADLLLKDGLLHADTPYLDYYCAINRQQKKLFLILLNDDDEPMNTLLKADYTKLNIIPKKVFNISSKKEGLQLNIAPYGINVVQVDY